MTRFYVDGNGSYIGGFDGVEPPSGAIEIPNPPFAASDTWTGSEWVTATIDPLTLPLPRLNFWLAAAQAGVDKLDFAARIAAMPPGLERREAVAWFDEAQQYRRDDPLLIAMAAAEGIDAEQLDTLWSWAVPLT